MQDLTRLSSLAEAEIEALEKEGICLSPAELVEVNALAWQVEFPESRLLLSRGTPVEIGGAVLWPLTLHAAEWFRRVGCRLAGSFTQELALAYAMAHGRSTGGELDKGPLTAWFAVIWAWGTRLRCTRAELREACSQIIRQDEAYEAPPSADPENDVGMSPGELSAFVATASKADPTVIERHLSIGYVRAMIASIVQQNKVDDKPSASDPRIQADIALAYRIEQIRASRKEATRGQ